MPDTWARVSGPKHRTAEAGRRTLRAHGIRRPRPRPPAQEKLARCLLEAAGESPGPMALARHHGVTICLIA